MADTTRQFSPEERASFLGWRYGSTLDWASLILTEIGYPVAENRWFVDAVCGIFQRTKAHYPDAGVPISHSTLAKRGQRFKNKAQASELARAAIERHLEHARLRRVMVFDIERPKPHERKGRDKRAQTRYTDYLTPAAVWAQECEQRIKKADPAAWKGSQYRGQKRADILAEAVGMLPAFDSVEEMPADAQEARCVTCEKAREEGDDSPRYKKDCPGHTLPLGDYVAQRETLIAAERRRIIDRITDGRLVRAEEIDERLAALDAFYAREKKRLEKDYESTRAVLQGMRDTRLIRTLDFTDPEEISEEVDAMLGRDADGRDPAERPADWLAGLHTRGNVGLTPSVGSDDALSSSPSSGKRGFKGKAGVTPIEGVA